MEWLGLNIFTLRTQGFRFTWNLVVVVLLLLLVLAKFKKFKKVQNCCSLGYEKLFGSMFILFEAFYMTKACLRMGWYNISLFMFRKARFFVVSGMKCCKDIYLCNLDLSAYSGPLYVVYFSRHQWFSSGESSLSF